MVTEGLLVRLEARSGQDAAVEEFLLSALPLVLLEPATTAWFAVRFGRSEYGIFDVFPDESGRQAHLSGPVAGVLMEQAGTLLAAPPRIEKLDVLAHRLPQGIPARADTKGLLLTFEAKDGHAAEVERFLRDARAYVMEEPETTAWFAIRTADRRYGIFDTFPDGGGRFKHLIGKVPRELAGHALSLLGSVPEMQMLDVIAEKFGDERIAVAAE
jgi:quinol monooxygenase YgiN